MSRALRAEGAQIDGDKFREALCFPLRSWIGKSAEDVLPHVLANRSGEITGIDYRLRGGKGRLHCNCGLRLTRTAYRVSIVVRTRHLIVYAVTCPAPIDDATGICKLSA